MSIRESHESDINAINLVLRDAFGEEDEVKLVQALRDDKDIEIELVHESEGVVDGHVLLSPMQAPVRALAFAPLSVLPEKQGKGIGSKLSFAALKQAAEDGWEAVFVLGDPDYYQRFGFSLDLAKPFSSPYSGAHFMALELKQDCLKNRSGELIHSPAFARIEG